MDKALLIGINNYESISDLRGCHNDVTNLRNVLTNYYQFDPNNISVLCDYRAIKKKIMDRMDWLYDGAKAGDRIVFHFSGHGSQVIDLDGDERKRQPKDYLDEMLCLYNMDWDDRDSYLTDDILGSWAEAMATGVHLTIVLDCCHSGTGTRELVRPPWDDFEDNKGKSISDWTSEDWKYFADLMGGKIKRENDDSLPRYYAPPTDIACRVDETRSYSTKKLFKSLDDNLDITHTLLTGCRDDQTSADAYINGDFHGAFTYYLCKSIRNRCREKVNYEKLIKQVRQSLHHNQYTQVPQLEGIKGREVFG